MRADVSHLLLATQVIIHSSLFVDLTQLPPTTRQLAQQQFALGEYHLYYQLPQTGTALTVRLDTQHMLDYAEAHDIPDTALKEVQLKWIDYQWKR